MATRHAEVDLLQSYLDDLAGRVAEALDRGDEAAAWDMTVALQRSLDAATELGARPSSPVIGRRFARIHRRVLRAARGGPGQPPLDALALMLGLSSGPAPVGAPPRHAELAPLG